VQVATDLLAQLGDVDAPTMRAVATAAGVTAPSVYRHFPDKQALVRTVITERFVEFTSALHTAAEAAGDQPIARLEAMARAYVRSGLEHPGHYLMPVGMTLCVVLAAACPRSRPSTPGVLPPHPVTDLTQVNLRMLRDPSPRRWDVSTGVQG